MTLDMICCVTTDVIQLLACRLSTADLGIQTRLRLIGSTNPQQPHQVLIDLIATLPQLWPSACPRYQSALHSRRFIDKHRGTAEFGMTVCTDGNDETA